MTRLMGIVGFLCIFVPCSARSVPTDDTTKAVIDVLKHAHDANLGRYPSGKLRVLYRSGTLDPTRSVPDRHESVEADVQWLGDEVRTVLKRWGPDKTEPDRSGPPSLREVCILNRVSIASYNYMSTIFVEPIAGKTVSPEYRLAPTDCWYASQLFEGRSCLEGFLPGKNSPSSAPGVVVTVLPGADGTVRLNLAKIVEKASLDVTYSYALDGNVIRFALDSSVSGMKVKGDYQWERDPRGRVRLRKFERRKELKHGSATRNLYEIVEVLDFDPDFVPSREVFRLESLKVPEGTIVQDKVSGKTYRTGDRAISKVSEKFEDLIAAARSRGFSSPLRR